MDSATLRAAARRPRGPLGIRLGDVGMTAVVITAVELSVVTGNGPHTAPLNAFSLVFGGVLGLPVLVRNRWPRQELIACSVLLFLYYTFNRRNISPRRCCACLCTTPPWRVPW